MEVDDAEGKSGKRKEEATSERLSNLSRVVPAQLPHISFPDDCRFTPVRSVASSASNTTAARVTKAAKTKAGTSVGSGSAAAAVLASSSTGPTSIGGGIVVLKDTKPGQDGVEYFELESLRSAAPPAAEAGASAAPATGADALAVDMSAPIADPRKLSFSLARSVRAFLTRRLFAAASFEYDFRD